MVDKYAVKSLITNAIGGIFIVEPLGVWDTVEEIEWDKLPDRFVLKCTHDSGSVCLCRDKNTFDKEAAKAKLQRGLDENYFLGKREWAYKGVKPRVLAEPFIEGLGTLDSTEYKLTCMNGEVKFITVCGGIAHSAYEDRTNDHFTKDWQKLDWYVNYKPSGKKIEKPAFMDGYGAFN